MDYTGCNVKTPVMYVMHHQMKRRLPQLIYQSHCARCPEGQLLVHFGEDFAPLPEDTCTVCGQRYHYMDVSEIGKEIWK